jgi:hypothetical protein
VFIYCKLVIGVNIYVKKKSKFELFNFFEMWRTNAIFVPDEFFFTIFSLDGINSTVYLFHEEL